MGRLGFAIALVVAAGVAASCGSSKRDDTDGDGAGGSAGTSAGGAGSGLGGAPAGGSSGTSAGGASSGNAGTSDGGSDGEAGTGAAAGEATGGSSGDAGAGGAGAMAGSSAIGGRGTAGGGMVGGVGGRGGNGSCPVSPTTIEGVVHDPSGTLPIYNALVYVPSTDVAALPNGVSCDRCYGSVSGAPVSMALTDTQGRFVLRNTPSGSNVKLVVQVGKWRRIVTLPTIHACATNPLQDPALTRLPRNSTEGDLPRIALTTGAADAYECLLRKMGISDSEFTPDTGTGRVHLYAAGDGVDGMGATRLASGATFSAATTLWSNPAKLAGYDVLMMSCEGISFGSIKSPYLANIESYVNAGGRMLGGHLQAYWLSHGSQALQSTATYGSYDDPSSPTPLTVDQSFPKGAAFADWLMNVEASVTKGTLTVGEAQSSVSAVAPPTARWLHAYDPLQSLDFVQHMTFNTPVGQPFASQCGRVAFSDLHVGAATRDRSQPDVPFPNGCNANWSPEAKALAFLIFDLANCIASDAAAPTLP